MSYSFILLEVLGFQNMEINKHLEVSINWKTFIEQPQTDKFKRVLCIYNYVKKRKTCSQRWDWTLLRIIIVYEKKSPWPLKQHMWIQMQNHPKCSTEEISLWPLEQPLNNTELHIDEILLDHLNNSCKHRFTWVFYHLNHLCEHQIQLSFLFRKILPSHLIKPCEYRFIRAFS